MQFVAFNFKEERNCVGSFPEKDCFDAHVFFTTLILLRQIFTVDVVGCFIAECSDKDILLAVLC